MSEYFVKGKGWRYDFTLKGQRYTDQWYPSKKEAKQAEAKRREEILNPELIPEQPKTQTGITFLELVNYRLDHVKAYNSERHYSEYLYMAKQWVGEWEKLDVRTITQAMIEKFLFKRLKVSPFTANKEIRYLRSTFNFGKKRAFFVKTRLMELVFSRWRKGSNSYRQWMISTESLQWLIPIHRITFGLSEKPWGGLAK